MVERTTNRLRARRDPPAAPVSAAVTLVVGALEESAPMVSGEL